MAIKKLTPIVLASAFLILPIQAIIASEQRASSAELLASARLWTAKSRPDLAQLALKKILLSDPNNAEAILLKAQLDISTGRRESLPILMARLKSFSPNSLEYRQLSDMMRMQGADGQQLRMASAMARSGRGEEATEVVRRLFPNGPAGGDLSLQYYQILGSSPKNWLEVRIGLERLVRDTPTDPRYRLALAAHYTLRDATRPRGVSLLADMAHKQDVDKAQLLPLWKRGIINFDDDSSPIALVQQYLAFVPDDKEVQQKLARLRLHGERARHAAIERNDPAVRLRESALLDMSRGDDVSAEAQLNDAVLLRPKDAIILGALGRIKLRRGDDEAAEQRFAQALAADNENRREWQGLLNTSKFWGLMKQARQSRDSNALDLAEQQCRAALAINKAQPDALAMLANLSDLRGDPVAAEAQYTQILAKNPDNSAAMDGLVTLLTTQNRQAEASVLLDTLDKVPGARSKVSATKASMMRRQADELVALGQVSDAIAVLKSAVLLAPSDPWLRYDLARLYLKQGAVDNAQAVMKPLSTETGDNVEPGAHYAYALFMASRDDNNQALRAMERIPVDDQSDSMRSFVQRLQLENALAAVSRDAGLSAQVVDITAFSQPLTLAEQLAGDAPELNYRVAVVYADLGAPAQGLSLMLRGLRRAQAAVVGSPLMRLEQRISWALNYARYLDHTQSEAALEAELVALEAHPQNQTDGQNSAISQLRQQAILRRIDTLRRAGDLPQARAEAALASQHYPDNVGVQLAQARIELDDSQTSKALVLYQRILKKSADSLDAQLGVADAHLLAGNEVAAQATLEQLETHIRVENSSDRFALARRYARLKQHERARALVNEQLERYPDRPDVLSEAGSFEESQRNYDKAASLYAKAAERAGKKIDLADIKLEPSVNASAAERGLSRLEKRKDGYITNGTIVRSKSGSEGLSQSTVVETPTEFYLPMGYAGHFIGHIDRVDFNAGRLPIDAGAQRLFGKVQALSPTGVATEPERSDGVALGVGYETDDYRADVGTTPLGFPVANIVGGLKLYRSTGNSYSTLDISRRPMTSSLLAYAGAYDPVTRQTWGGVVRSGATYRRSMSEGRRTRSFSLTGNILTGEHVSSNRELRAVLGQNYDVLVKPNDIVNAGASLTLWSFQRDQSNFTFGQGGYYSPQSYVSLSLPLSWTGRHNKWSYLLAPAVGVSWSRTAASLYYPTDANLQALGNNPLYNAAMYSGSSGTSFNYSLQGALEYRLLPNWYVGSSFQLDRAPYYSPNILQMYLRYELKPKTGEVPFPPRPVRSYADF